MNVWQIATGDRGRDYSGVFLKHDVMILGPGEYGAVDGDNYASGPPNSMMRQVHNFAYNPQPGDRVLMRFCHKVIAVGQIPAGEDNQYKFDEAFGCVYGWNLRHRRRVKWAQGLDLGNLAHVFSRSTKMPSFTRVNNAKIVSLVQKIDPQVFSCPLASLPEFDNSNFYNYEELGVILFQAGISNQNIDAILKGLQQAARLCAWYNSFKQDSKTRETRPSEHEVISHVILPIFLGLGWSHQQIAVEWNHVDVAFFKVMPAQKENCVMIIEAKGLGQALGEVFDQPRQYVSENQLSNTRFILTTDGTNLFVYEKKGSDWDTDPIGYINFLNLQKEYVIPENTNLVKTLVMLQPAMV